MACGNDGDEIVVGFQNVSVLNEFQDALIAGCTNSSDSSDSPDYTAAAEDAAAHYKTATIILGTLLGISLLALVAPDLFRQTRWGDL